jgi:hypothetical protein
VVLLLVAELLRLEPEAPGRGATSYSINKASAGDNPSRPSGVVMSPSLRRRGGDWRRAHDDAADGGLGWLQGKSWLQFGDQHMVAMVCHHDFRPIRRPLQMPKLASAQPSVWRPLQGFLSASYVLLAPSGSVPGGDESGWRWSPSSVDGDKGPDCFSSRLFRVLSANLQDCVVILFLYVSCSHLVTPPTISSTQH